MKPLYTTVFLLFIWACESQPSLKIATASNMQFAMTEIARKFEQKHHVTVDLITSSSGKLTAQIEQGAPFDIFVSADMKYPSYLHEKQLTIGAPKVYAYGQLVLWTCYDFEPTLDLLRTDSIQKIAIANPETAPYGRAALNVFQRNWLWPVAEDKLVYAESISQCNQFITSKTVDVGFTALSVVLSPKIKDLGHWTLIGPGHYNPIAQGIVRLKRAESNTAAKEFYDYIQSEEAKAILDQYGYLRIQTDERPHR